VSSWLSHVLTYGYLSAHYDESYVQRGTQKMHFISKKVDGAQIANYTLHLALVNGG